LPIVEINLSCVPDGFNKIYSYEVKWFFDTRENKLDIFTCPAKTSAKLTKAIEKLVLDAYKALRIRDWARFDVRCDRDENPYIIEVNPLPGILPNPDDNSCFPKAARMAGMDYDTLIQTVLNLAIERYNLK
jgi:D-alanine-D-alanine ligase